MLCHGLVCTSAAKSEASGHLARNTLHKKNTNTTLFVFVYASNVWSPVNLSRFFIFHVLIRFHLIILSSLTFRPNWVSEREREAKGAANWGIYYRGEEFTREVK